MASDYSLAVRVDHMRRTSMASLLFSLAQQALISERRGESFEQVHCHLTGDGDYSAIAVVYPTDRDAGPTVSRTIESEETVAEDDISAVDRILHQEQRDRDEAERLQRIEAFKQAEAERWARQRESK